MTKTEVETTWGHFYADSGSSEYYEQHVSIHQPFLEAILNSKPARLLETGCGSGIMSVYFSKQSIQCVALDRAGPFEADEVFE